MQMFFHPACFVDFKLILGDDKETKVVDHMWDDDECFLLLVVGNKISFHGYPNKRTQQIISNWEDLFHGKTFVKHGAAKYARTGYERQQWSTFYMMCKSYADPLTIMRSP